MGNIASELRKRFPLLNNSGVHFLDSAASAQKPDSVLQSMQDFYQQEYANIHRGLYRLSEKATARYEAVRKQAAKFVGVSDAREIVFTTGTTDGINLLAYSLAPLLLDSDSEILLSIAEHHSNIVPWQLAAERTGARIRFIPLTEDMTIDLKQARQLVTPKTKIVAIAHVSNVTGAINPIAEIATLAKNVGACMVVDGAQGAVHLPVSVGELGCDFYTISSHKLGGPTGIGILWGKLDWFVRMPPFRGGGEMIERVTTSGSTWAPPPHKFEAGTPPIAEVIGLGAALEFLDSLPRQEILAHEKHLGSQVAAALETRSEIRLLCPRDRKHWVGIVSFHHATIHAHDMAAIQDAHGVAVRAGHHCAQPLMDFLNIESTTRVSPFLYNTSEDIERFLFAFSEAEKMFCI
jgi:cysteine desulfurase/selenocysteine lyase